MSRSILLSVLFLLPVHLVIGKGECTKRIIKTSDEINKSIDNTTKINSIRFATFKKNTVVFTGQNDKKITCASNTIWGYQENNCDLYRCYDECFVKVAKIDNIVIYYRASNGNVKGIPVKSTDWYFSKSLDAPIYILNWKNIQSQFKGNDCFLNKLKSNLKRKNYSEYNEQTKTYYIIDLYKGCK